ncbi:MAG: response regulator transcription factor [Acutalibacteraceae bacterium]|nr:response regulator transcription factor [Acutalibacteraceae bacterium]
MIYLVEDDANIRELVVYTLNSTGYESRGFGTPSEFWKAMDEQLPQLVLLDIMLPEESGLSILEKIRKDRKTKKLPVIMLTAKGSEIDKVRGFELGADDYIPKPFGMMELVARVKALLRRTGENEDEVLTEYEIGDLYVSPKKHKVKVAGERVSLTRKEFEMLCCLLENKNIVLTRDQLLNKIWGYSFDGESRTVDVHIRTLRRKLGDAGKIIKTVRGIGYMISDEPD